MDADAAHWAACKVKGCARCVFIRNREEWQAKLPMGDLGVSWLHGYLDRDDGLFKLKCRACEKNHADEPLCQWRCHDVVR